MLIPEWFPEQPPIYDIGKTYADNAKEGPFFDAPIPQRPGSSSPIHFLGLSLSSRLGVPAGPLLNAKWVALASKLGFDLLTYKTIRSSAYSSHPLPNMIYVSLEARNKARSTETPKHLEQLTLTSSFGAPSQSPDFLLQDIERAHRSLEKGQALIVSVVGTPNTNTRLDQDFILAAMIAKEAGAKLIEANFSCPDIKTQQGALYTDPEAVERFCKAISTAIHPIPLIIKVGVIENEKTMRDVFLAAGRGGAQAICGINSVYSTVIDEVGNPALGADRTQSGICGASIRKEALQFLACAAAIIHKEKLDLTLMGCGGIVRSEQFNSFLQNGADIALSATGMMWDPFLALRYHWKGANAQATSHPLSL